MKDKRFDVVALGELLIDFTQNGLSDQGNLLFEANPGGAPANVLAMLRKLNRHCAFIGKVGKDSFGDLLENVLLDTGIDVSCLRRDERINTTLAVVHTFPNGDRDFSFYRKPGADMLLRPEELDEDMLRGCRIFHFGTLSMTDEPCRSATIRAMDVVKEAGALISFDPNLRPPLWRKLDDAKDAILWGLGQCDILKIADNELEFVTGVKDFDSGAEILQKKYPNIRLLNVTAGSEGSYSYCGKNRVFMPACSLGGVIDTTGAGYTFCACILNYVLENGLRDYSEKELKEMLSFANAAAYLVTTKKGAIRSMPDRECVEALLQDTLLERE